MSLVDPEFGRRSAIVGSALATRARARLRSRKSSKRRAATRRTRRTWPTASTGPTRPVKAILASPAWPRTLLIYTYDEHGGYYDHVRPPAAIEPDSIQPELGPEDVPGGYDIYGPRVPAIVASPYSKPNAVTNVVHDHTSFLATVEAKWNLPRLTYRDANAKTVMDFLDPRSAAFMEPPTLVEPPAPTGALATP